MDALERVELEAEQAAREDYLHEAYMSEAKMLDDQALDERADRCGFTSWQAMRAADLESARRRRAAESIGQGKAARDPANDVPF
jgi:hypothetical protein